MASDSNVVGQKQKARQSTVRHFSRSSMRALTIGAGADGPLGRRSVNGETAKTKGKLCMRPRRYLNESRSILMPSMHPPVADIAIKFCIRCRAMRRLSQDQVVTQGSMQKCFLEEKICLEGANVEIFSMEIS